jgi:NitT/TauT family transport system substrate-binding protein
MSRILPATAIASVLALTGCTLSDPGDPGTESTQNVRIAVANPSCVFFFPLYVAIDQGYFEDEGLTVEPVVADGSAAVLQAMLAGQVDVGTPAPTPLIFARAEGADIKFVANATPGGVFALVAPSDSGYTDATDLRGATIGVSTADGGEVAFLEEIMRGAGLDDGDYEILVVGEAGQALAGFSRGDIDAYSASLDGVAMIEYGGIQLDNLSGDDTGHMFGNGLAASETYIAEHPDVIEAFGRAFRAGLDAGFEDVALVIETCQKHQPQEVEDAGFVAAFMKAVRIGYTPADDSAFGENVPEQWQRIVDSLVAAGELDEGALPVEELYTNEFVPAFQR